MEGASKPELPAARDRALDMARGYAIVAMITSHVGAETALSMAANFPYLLSAADGFFLVSGAAMGLVAERKLTSSTRPFYAQLLVRAARLYAIHCLLTLIVIVIHHLTGRLRTPDIGELGGFPMTLFQIATLRVQPLDYMNILPLFVVYFVVTPLVLECVRRARSWVALGCSTLLWLIAQSHPDLLPLPAPGPEPSGFSLIAWQFPFVVGVLLGYHRRSLLDRFERLAPWVRFSLLVVIGVEFLLAQFQRTHFQRFQLALPAGAREAWLSKQTFAPLHAVYALSLIVFGYGVFRALVAFTERTSNRVSNAIAQAIALLEFVGRNSLFCFVAHLPFALLASAVHSSEWPRVAQNLFTLTAIACVYLAARSETLVRALRV